MKIGFTNAPGKGDTDLILFQLAETLMKDGLRVAGTVQINTEIECDGPCDMDVRILPSGPDLRISQSLGKHARGCRLDPEALERSVAQVEKVLEQGADLLIVNKFGKHEADGRGFRPVIAEALYRDIPVIVGLNALNKDPFEAFVGQSVDEVPPTVEALRAWVLNSATSHTYVA